MICLYLSQLSNFFEQLKQDFIKICQCAFRGRKQAESDDDDASINFNGEDSGSEYDENERLLLEKTRKELAQGTYDSDEESEVI